MTPVVLFPILVNINNESDFADHDTPRWILMVRVRISYML